jgi:TorA maturation chaperone TorD
VFGPGGPVPPREASYHASVELGSLMSEIEGDYAAFAYQPETDEPPDHIAIETGFIAYLRLKEAFACATGDEESAQIARRASERFTADHLSHLAHPLAGLLDHSGVAYLAEASSIIAARVGPKPPTRQLPVIQPGQAGADDEGEFSCDL